jgi:hypothetical protein
MNHIVQRSTTYFTLIVSVILLVHCEKANSSKWIVADLTVLDYYTHEPVVIGVRLSYHESAFPSQGEDKTETLGQTGVDGTFHLERRVYHNEGGFQLKIAGNGGYGIPLFDFDIQTIPIYTKQENKHIIYLAPYRLFDLYLTNTNCSGSTDSVWISDTNAPLHALFTGCQNTLHTNTNAGFYSYTKEPLLELNIVTKKAGIIDSFTQVFPLQEHQLTTVHVNY